MQLGHIDKIAVTATYAALTTYLLAVATYIRVTTPVKLAYGLCALTAVALPVLLRLAGRPLPEKVPKVTGAGIAVSALFFIPAGVFPEGRSLVYVLTDSLTTILPLGFLFAGSLSPSMFRKLVSPAWIGALLAPTVAAPLLVQDGTGARFFEPPSVGVSAVLAAIVISTSGTRTRMVTLLLLGGLTTLGFMSGSRSVALILIAVFVFASLASRAWWFLGAMALILIVAVAVDHSWESGLPRYQPLTQATERVQRLFTPNESSVVGRLGEASLVLEEMRKRPAIWSVTGMGHGAVFEPEVWDRNPDLLSSEGYVHNIHVGPVLLLYRYGVLGVGLYLWFFVSAARGVISAVRKGSRQTRLQTALSLGLLLFLAEFTVRNVLPNPVFSFFLAGHVAVTLGVLQPMFDEAEHDTLPLVALP